MTEGKPAIRLQRATFVVSDLERALAFWRDVLGLSVDFVSDSDAASYSYPVFDVDRSASLRFAVLGAPGQPRMMGLTEVTPADGAALPPVPHPRRAAVVLDVADVDGVVARARAAGFFAYPEERLVTNDGRTGREIGLVDADDNLAVVYSITGRVEP